MSTTVSAGATTGVFKICCVCRANVTDKKRMKDSTTGRYWCYECYLADQNKQSRSGVTMRCPHCHKDYPPLKMLKHGEVYWCESCTSARSARDKSRRIAHDSSAPADAGSRGIRKLLALAAMVGTGALVYSYLMFWS